MPVANPVTIFSKCAPLIREDFTNCEGLTMCDVSPTTSDELDSIYKDSSNRFRDMGSLLETSMVGKMCGITENSLYDFLVANAVKYEAPPPRKAANSSVQEFEPFFPVRRRGVINTNYWKYTNGTATPGTAPGGDAYTHYVDAVSISSIPADPNFFPVGMEIFISAISTSGTAVRTAYVVVEAINQDSTTTRLYVNSRNAASVLPASKLSFTASGLIFRGLNNVAKSESYCSQIPALNPNAQYLAWIQDTRWSMCEDDLTLEYKRRIVENNPLYREFIHVEQVETNRQIAVDFKKRLANAFLFSKPISANQTEVLWKNLATVTSFDAPNFDSIASRCVGRKANMVGVYEQLYACSRVLDLQGQRLNFVELQQYLYDIQRIREENGGNGRIVEIVVDSAYRPQLIQGLWRYLTGRYEGAIRANMPIPTSKTTALGFTFTDFDLDYPAGLTLRIVSHRSFDDLITAHRQVSTTMEAAGRWMLLLDWSTIHLGVIETKMVTRRSASAEEWAKFNEDAFCTIDIPQKSVKLYSAKVTCIVDCPAASLWLENFSFEVPEHEQTVGAIDAAGNWTAND